MLEAGVFFLLKNQICASDCFNVRSTLNAKIKFYFRPIPLSDKRLTKPQNALFFGVVHLRIPQKVGTLSSAVLNIKVYNLSVRVIF